MQIGQGTGQSLAAITFNFQPQSNLQRTNESSGTQKPMGPPLGDVTRGEGPPHMEALKELGGNPTGNLQDDIALMEELMLEQDISVEELEEKTGVNLDKLKQMAKQGPPPNGQQPPGPQSFQMMDFQNMLASSLIDAFA